MRAEPRSELQIFAWTVAGGLGIPEWHGLPSQNEGPGSDIRFAASTSRIFRDRFRDRAEVSVGQGHDDLKKWRSKKLRDDGIVSLICPTCQNVFAGFSPKASMPATRCCFAWDCLRYLSWERELRLRHA
jgi:hypothetical protein